MNSKLPLRSPLFFVIISVLMSGCVTAYTASPLPVTHPANPSALEASPPPPSSAFRSEPLPFDQAAYEPTQNSHVGHGAMPGMHGGH